MGQGGIALWQRSPVTYVVRPVVPERTERKDSIAAWWGQVDRGRRRRPRAACYTRALLPGRHPRNSVWRTL